MVSGIYCTSLVRPQTKQFINNAEQVQPKYYCATCLKLKDGNYCDCFQRPVDKNYHRCFNHSNYNPINAVFKAPDNIEEIALENEMKEIA